MKKIMHNCGRGFKGVVKIVQRPGIGMIKFCEFCGKEFMK